MIHGRFSLFWWSHVCLFSIYFRPLLETWIPLSSIFNKSENNPLHLLKSVIEYTYKMKKVNIRSYMSHPANEALVDRAETEAIEYVLNLGLRDLSNGIFDKMVDKKAEEILQDLINRPGPHG